MFRRSERSMYCGWEWDLAVRASDCQCQSCNSPGFNPSILQNGEIWGAADEAVFQKVILKNPGQDDCKKGLAKKCF